MLISLENKPDNRLKCVKKISDIQGEGYSFCLKNSYSVREDGVVFHRVIVILPRVIIFIVMTFFLPIFIPFLVDLNPEIDIGMHGPDGGLTGHACAHDRLP